LRLRESGRFLIIIIIFFSCALALVSSSLAQTPASRGESTPAPAPPAKPAPGDEENVHAASAAPGPLLRNLVADQKSILTSPFKVRLEDLSWLAPVAGLTAGLINADAELSSRISTTGTLVRRSSTLSNGGLALMVGGAGSLYLLGKSRGDDHQQEAGILAGEAGVNSLAVAEVLKLATLRERPKAGSGLGRFGQSRTGLDGSFPSVHAAVAWSVASVLAHEYPGVITQVLGYGLATGISVARVTGRDHFPSDVVAGSAIGWLIGRQVYASHHNSELPGGAYGTFTSDDRSETGDRGNSWASPYVPMDSWVYPAFERLAALGVVDSGLFGLRPWTRRECARLLEEAADSVDESSPDAGEPSRLYNALAGEFSAELEGNPTEHVALDSIYARATEITGKPLTDGYHFGQTIVNDFGRPYQQGANGLGGFSGNGVLGPFGFYIRGEYEHAPSAPGVSQAVQDGIQQADAKTTTAQTFGPIIFQKATAIPAFNQFRLLDTYVMLNIKGWQTSFGKQTVWTGPTQDPFLSSDNAEPMYMLKVDQITPTKLPSYLGLLGPMRTVVWIGKLTGEHYVNTQDGNIAFRQGRSLSRQPMVNGVKVSFKPTPNFEFSVGRTGLWGGPDFPITFHTTRLSFL
jgi:hypothetical protein